MATAHNLGVLEEFVKKTYFKPSVNNIIVKIRPTINDFPVPSCDLCAAQFDKCGLQASVGDVCWELIGASTYS